MDFTFYSDLSTTLGAVMSLTLKKTAKGGACLPAQSSDSHSKLSNPRQGKTSVSFGFCICPSGDLCGLGQGMQTKISFKSVSHRNGPIVALLQFRSGMFVDGQC